MKNSLYRTALALLACFCVAVAALAADEPQGNVAAGATDKGNPLKVGGKYNATPPTLTDGQRGDLQLDAAGNVRVTTVSGTGTSSITVQGTAAHDAAVSGNPVRAGARARASNVTAVASDDTVDVVATTVGVLVQKPYSIPEVDWSYPAASTGITNTTTAVVLVAAPAAGIRNYVTSCQLSADTLGAATELTIRDGAGGTVIWRHKLQTAALAGLQVQFPSPLRGTAATLLEVATLTAVTGGVYVNCQGYQAP